MGQIVLGAKQRQLLHYHLCHTFCPQDPELSQSNRPSQAQLYLPLELHSLGHHHLQAQSEIVCWDGLGRENWISDKSS